ncbi:MAG: hypothetical protein ACLR2J_07710 [Actinomyces sp.]
MRARIPNERASVSQGLVKRLLPRGVCDRERGARDNADARAWSGCDQADQRRQLDVERGGVTSGRSDDPTKALALTGIRAATHEGFTRVVLEFSGEGTPGVWSAAWTDEAVEQGRGLPIQVEGQAVLDLVIDGTPMTASENPYPSGMHTRVGDLDVVSDGTFEDNTHVVIGAPAARQFQIGFLSDPVRMVIDVRD